MPIRLAEYCDLVPMRNISIADTILQAIFADSRSRVRAYSDVSFEFTTKSNVSQGYSTSPFLSNTASEVITWIAQSACENGGIHLCSDRNLYDSEYTEDAVMLSEDSSKLQDSEGCISHFRDVKLRFWVSLA